MSNKIRKSIKPVYVPEDFNIESELASAPVLARPSPERKAPRRLSSRVTSVEAAPPAEEPRSYSPRNLTIGVNSLEETTSKEGTLRHLGFQLNHAIESRNANYFHVTSKQGHDAYVKTPLRDESTFDPKEMSPRTRGFLIPAKKTTALHYPLEMREKALQSCGAYCVGVALQNKDRSAITFVEPDGYDTHFFEVESNTPLPIIHFDSLLREESAIHETIAKATRALEYQVMDSADNEINAFLEKFAEIQKSMQNFSNHCDKILADYTAQKDEASRQELARKYATIARKIEASRGALVELQEVIEDLIA